MLGRIASFTRSLDCCLRAKWLSRLARGEPIGGTTVAPALKSASVDNVRGPSSPTCVRSQNTNATQTANEFFASLNIKGVLYSDKDGVFFDGIAVTPDGKTLCGIVQFKKTWEEFWDNAESQDLLHSYTVEYVVGLPGSPLNPNTRAVTGTVMVIATLAPSLAQYRLCAVDRGCKEYRRSDQDGLA